MLPTVLLRLVFVVHLLCCRVVVLFLLTVCLYLQQITLHDLLTLPQLEHRVPVRSKVLQEIFIFKFYFEIDTDQSTIDQSSWLWMIKCQQLLQNICLIAQNHVIICFEELNVTPAQTSWNVFSCTDSLSSLTSSWTSTQRSTSRRSSVPSMPVT